MMTSNLLSRLLPTNPQGRSIYDDLRTHDEESDLEEQAGLALDEENLRFRDDELGAADAFGEDSRITTESTAFLSTNQNNTQFGGGNALRAKSRSRWMAQSPRLLEEDGDDDVPASLLIEGNEIPALSTPTKPRPRQGKAPKRQTAIPGPSNRETRAHWEAAQAQQRLHHEEENSPGLPQPTRHHFGPLSGSAREKAMWRWINVVNLDSFIEEVYEYYIGAGIWCIVLDKALNLAQIIFVAVFTTFLTQCVDYSAIPHSKKLSQVLVPQCTKKISGMPNVAIWLFTLHIFWRVYQLLIDIPRLMRIRDFFVHLLEVPDGDMQTISWQDVVARIMALRDANPVTAEKISPQARKYLGSQSKQRLDAHDIANRLMRKENYLIAMFNKDILDLTLPFPFLQDRQLFSRTLLWNLDWCVMGLIFNDSGQVRQLILKDSHRRQLSEALRGRFLFAGFMNVIFAPVIVIYLMIVYFLRYFNEYKKDPSAIGSRQYTPLAEWKFREFNELHHLFHKRVNMSYPFASRYLDQFPKVKSVQLARFMSFIAGAIVSVLAVATLWDPESFLSFDITSDRTVLFYLTVFGGIWAAMNGMIPEENLVFEPEYALRQVIEYTHYMPTQWQNRLHSDEVKREFATLYQLKIVIFLEEVLSIIVTPFILWFSLPKCSDQIIDFFREFTIHVDGVGYVCSFAVFDFKKGDGRKALHGGGNADIRDEYYSTKHGKMAASYYGFLDNYLLNPKTAVQGHVPPGQRHHHPHPLSRVSCPPPWEQNCKPPAWDEANEDPAVELPEQSHRQPVPPASHQQLPTAHQCNPSSSIHTTSPPAQVRQNIIEEPVEDDEDEPAGTGRGNRSSGNAYDSGGGLDESRWETSPTRAAGNEAAEEEVEPPGGGGVLGLLYQFQKAQNDGRPGVI
ncbi:autophagy-related protein 9 [Rhexocercosporidium sp. MPI-PUGE-AT-0058]|nr:autophagy-related protein 9 [Rhexocercosporidium sp. MPI-PUGE-AT-0058]